MTIGRPSIYDPAFCQEAEQFIAEGYSVAAFAGHIGVAVRTVYNWMESHPEFMHSVKVGQAGAVAWWEKRLRDMAENGQGNATAIIFGLKNRAPEEWRDKTETEHSGSVTVDSPAEKLAQFLNGAKSG